MVLQKGEVMVEWGEVILGLGCSVVGWGVHVGGIGWSWVGWGVCGGGVEQSCGMMGWDRLAICEVGWSCWGQVVVCWGGVFMWVGYNGLCGKTVDYPD